MTRSSPLLSLLIVILVLVSFVQASFGFTALPTGLRRIHRHGEVLTALNKAVNAPVNIIPGRGHGQFWEIIETKNKDMVHIYQVDSGLFLSPQNRDEPSPYTPLVLSPFPQEWKLVECECRHEENRFFIELPDKVNGKTLVLDNSRIHVYPPMAGLVPKEERNKEQLWELDEPNEHGYINRWNRVHWQ
ncbi:hypothetical protein BGZ80_004275 [Entomortierella chlamydospora]|uniref:Ricin B lectin domain-containing protein n=1 Tax=Entomortierella chlamydospora TaxID=101097 RepID=A0A9P6N5L8_9FUNG|nr:hypothetical protein BGZ79_008886 [Entomortierella chlamydospora]KAG0024313.1 hypothetical protein BGZ80_004275 [Entomortierella chlamydospora]